MGGLSAGGGCAHHEAALVALDGLGQGVDGLDVQVICRLIQQQLQESATAPFSTEDCGFLYTTQCVCAHMLPGK